MPMPARPDMKGSTTLSAAAVAAAASKALPPARKIRAPACAASGCAAATMPWSEETVGRLLCIPAPRVAPFDAGAARLPHKIVACAQHVIERAEGVGVVAGESFALDAPEHVGEIEIAGAGREMDLGPVAEAIGEAHLGDAPHIERIDEAGDAFGNEMRVVGGEG